MWRRLQFKFDSVRSDCPAVAPVDPLQLSRPSADIVCLSLPPSLRLPHTGVAPWPAGTLRPCATRASVRRVDEGPERRSLIVVPDARNTSSRMRAEHWSIGAMKACTRCKDSPGRSTGWYVVFHVLAWHMLTLLAQCLGCKYMHTPAQRSPSPDTTDRIEALRRQRSTAAPRQRRGRPRVVPRWRRVRLHTRLANNQRSLATHRGILERRRQRVNALRQKVRFASLPQVCPSLNNYTGSRRSRVREGALGLEHAPKLPEEQDASDTRSGMYCAHRSCTTLMPTSRRNVGRSSRRNSVLLATTTHGKTFPTTGPVKRTLPLSIRMWRALGVSR